jgi:hypothetical protein
VETLGPWPETGANLLGILRSSRQESSSGRRSRRAARESGVGEVKRTPEKMHWRCPALKVGTGLLHDEVNLRQHSPESIRPFRLIDGVDRVLGKGNRIADLIGYGPEVCLDAERTELTHEVGVELRDRSGGQKHTPIFATRGHDHDFVVDEIDVNLEDPAREFHRCRRQTTRGQV